MLLYHKIARLRAENTDLKEEIEALKHPGTTNPRQALRYLVPPAKPIVDGDNKLKRQKAFQFLTLLTEDETRNHFLEMKEAERQKKEDVRQRKEEREKKREERELENERKKGEQQKKKMSGKGKSVT